MHPTEHGDEPVHARDRARGAQSARPPASRWSRLDAKQLGIIFAVTLASLYASYLFVANGLIVTGLLRDQINANPQAIAIDYTRARTWFPGRIELRHFTMRGRDDAVEWRLEIDHAVADIVLGDLLHRHFHTTRVRGDGIAFRLRRRLPAAAFTAKKTRALPPIEGFHDPPLAPAALHPSPTDENYRLFTATLENVEAEHVREVWIDMYRYVGDSRVVGSFHLKPIREVELGASRMDVRSGTIILDAHTVMDGLAGTADATIRRFDPRAVHGAALFDRISLALHLDGRLDDARFLDFYTGGRPALAGGHGPAHIHLLLGDGAIEEGTSIDVEGSGLVVRAGKYTVRASTHLRVRTKRKGAAAPRGDPGVMTTARLEADGTIARTGYAPVRVKRLVATARSAEPRLASGFDDAALGVAVDEIDAPDARVVASYADSDDMRVERGSARASFRFDVEPKSGAVRGEASATANAVVDVKKSRVAGTVHVGLRVPRASLVDGVVDLTGSSIAVDDASAVGGEHDATKHWSGRVDLAPASLHVGATTLECDAQIRGRDARPLLSIAPLSLPDWVSGWLNTDGLDGTIHARVGPSSVDADPIALEGGAYHLEGRYHARGGRSHGVFLVQKGLLSLGIELRDGSSRLVPLGASAWYRDQPR